MSVNEGVYWIHNLQWTNKVLDLDNENLAQGAKILNFDQHETFNKTLNQLWIVERFESSSKYIIRNLHSNLVLDLSDGSSTNGASIYCWNQHDGKNQQWRIEWAKDVNDTAYYHIVNVASGTAVSHNQIDSKTETVGWSIDGGGKQLWSFVPFSYPLVYRLRVKSTGHVLDIDNGSSTRGAHALSFGQHSATIHRNQLWRILNKSGSEGYTIQCLETGTVLDLSNGKSNNGAEIYGWKSHGERNQQWKMDTVDGDYQKITNVASGTVVDALLNDSRNRVGGWQFNGGSNQLWLVEQVPTPSPGWVLIQNGGTGKFLCSDPSGNINTTTGPETVFDKSVQWRFLQKDYTGIYTIINRGTGCVLRKYDSREPSVGLVKTTDNVDRDWWLLEAYEGSDAGLVSIINKKTDSTLDHYFGDSVQAFDVGENQPNRHWKIMPANDWVTSFALVNGETGLCLSAQYKNKEVQFANVNEVNDFNSQWIFRKVAQGPLFSIQNKANNHILGGSSARWQLVVCNEKYFGVRNNTTGKYLAIKNGQPTFQDTEMSNRHQCWELVSSRMHDASSVSDLVYMDDDLLEVMLPFLDASQGDKMKHRIEKRVAQKSPKDKTEWTVPSKERLTGTDNETVRTLLNVLINRWKWDIVNREEQSIQTLISFSQTEAEQILGSRLPQSLRKICANSSQPKTVFRLDRQGYVKIAGRHSVNLQGQFGSDTYFHITLPVGVKYGNEQIRHFLRESLERSTSVVVTPATCTLPSGGPRYRRDLWITWALSMLKTSTVQHSEL